MSYLSLSRVEDNPIGSLADVISVVRAAELPERRRQEILAALHTVARALDRPPERVPADPRRLLPRLRQIAPCAVGLSPGRWTNIRSLTRAGIAAAPGATSAQQTAPHRPLGRAIRSGGLALDQVEGIAFRAFFLVSRGRAGCSHRGDLRGLPPASR